MRSRAGYSPFTGNPEAHSPFTLSDCAEAVADFLNSYTNKPSTYRKDAPTVYYLEVTTTSADPQSTFPLSVAQMERVSHSRLSYLL